VDVCLFQTAVYNLKIVAVDGGMPALTSTADVTVELLDVNDSPPQFTNDNFTAILEVSQCVKCHVLDTRVMCTLRMTASVLTVCRLHLTYIHQIVCVCLCICLQ